MSEAAFFKEVERTIALYEKVSGRAATRTRQMIERHGAGKALSRLMASPDLQKGFKVLRDRGELDSSFEALVIRFRHFFNPDAVKAAQWRLEHPDELL